MTELSPVTQAVFEAVWAAYWHELEEIRHAGAGPELIAAAALRAAAIYAYCPVDRQRLAAIAAELESQP